MKNAPSKKQPPKWATYFFQWYCDHELQEELLGDLHERFEQHLKEDGIGKAKRRYWLNVCLLMNRHTIKRDHFLSNSNHMLFKNYLFMALRFMRKHPRHTFINILGLAIGLASCLLIFFYVNHERSYDQFHTQSDQIYRVNNFFTRASGEMRYPLIPPAVAPALKEGFREIKYTTRLRYDEGHWFGQGENRFYEDDIFFADSNFLKIFSFDMMAGDLNSALEAPNQVVITEEMAVKYFGRIDPLGESLLLDGNRQLEVTGILKNIPANSHIQFDFLISFSTFEITPGTLSNLNSWAWLGFLTYVLLEPQTDIEALEEKLVQLYHANVENRANLAVNYQLQPLEDIYMGSYDLPNPYGGMFQTGNPFDIYALSIVGLLILFIAGFNFMNLSLAISTTRNLEVGVRKVLGATQNGLFFRFLSESVLIVFFSLILGIGLVLFFAPLLQANLGWNTLSDDRSLLQFIPHLLGIALTVGIITGLYPSLVLARFKPLAVLKDQLSLNISGKLLRKGLIGFQFIVSIGLLIAAVVISQQLQFVGTKQLGFDQEFVISTRLSGAQQYESFKQSLLNYPDIISISRSSHVFDGGSGGNPMRQLGALEESSFQVSYYQVDEDFLDNMDISILEGRNFSPAFPRDSNNSILVNRALVQALELKNPIGQQVIFTTEEPKTIIGVIDDFHYASLHHEVAPFALLMPFTPIENVLIRVSGANLSNQLNNIEQVWQEVVPNQPFEYHFLDEQIGNQYAKEQKYATLISGFSILAIFIASLGLYSMMTFLIRMRMKEIGIRKVLGASIPQIMKLLYRQFTWIIVGANIIAWPLSAYFMQRWLDNFAYSIDLNIGIFAFAGFVVMIIAMLSLSFQVIKSSRINPANILRA